MDGKHLIGEIKEWTIVLSFLCLVEVGIACLIYYLLPLFY